MKKTNRWLALGLVGLLIIIIVAALGHKTPPSIVSGVTKSGVAKLDSVDGLSVKIDVPDGKYLAFANEGEVFEVVKVHDGHYTYKDVADDYSYHVTAYATDSKPDKHSRVSDINSIGKVKFKIPVESIASDEDDDESSSSSTDSDDYDTEEEDDDNYTDSDDTSAKTYRTDITFDQLARDPDTYKGEDFSMTGKVLQVMEDDDSVQLRIAINGDYDDVVLVDYDSSITDGKRVLEDDKVTFSGTSLGTTTYESTMGGDITVPAAIVDQITDEGTASDDYGYEY